MLDPLHLDFVLSLRSSAKLDLPVLALDLAGMEPLLPPKSSAQLGFAFFAFGVVRTGLILSILDGCQAGSPVFVRSLACLGPSLSATDFLNMGPPTSMQSLARLGSTAPATGIAHLGPVSLLPPTDCARSELSIFIRSMSCLASPMPALDCTHFGFAMPVRSLVHVGLPCLRCLPHTWGCCHRFEAGLSQVLGCLYWISRTSS